PTVLPRPRRLAVIRSTRVLLPAPGGPVTPITYARPVLPKIERTSAAASSLLFSISEMARAMARTSPAMTPSASVMKRQPPRPHRLLGISFSLRALRARWWCSGSSREQLPRDHKPLDLARALADRRQLDVAKIFFGRVVFHEAVSAENLDTVVGGPYGDLACVQLGHGRFERRALGPVFQVRRAVGQ